MYLHRKYEQVMSSSYVRIVLNPVFQAFVIPIHRQVKQIHTINAVLRIPGSPIPDPDFFPSRIPDPGSELFPFRIPDPHQKNLSILTQKMVSGL
jgi:hypothetical protein